MKLKIECEIEIEDGFWFDEGNEEGLEWFKSVLDDKEYTTLILWSNDIGDEIGQTSNFKYEIINEQKPK